HRHQHVDDQVRPAAVAEQLHVGQFQQFAVQLGGDQQDQGEADGDTVQVVETQYPPPGNAVQGQLVGDHWPDCSCGRWAWLQYQFSPWDRAFSRGTCTPQRAQ